MPMWDYQCEEGHLTTWIGLFKDRPSHVNCSECESLAELLEVSSPQRMKEFVPYRDDNLVPLGYVGEGPIIESREQRKNLKRKLGLHDQYHHKRGMPGQWV